MRRSSCCLPLIAGLALGWGLGACASAPPPGSADAPEAVYGQRGDREVFVGLPAAPNPRHDLTLTRHDPQVRYALPVQQAEAVSE